MSICVVCNKNYIIGGTVLQDGNSICPKCFSNIPHDLKNIAKVHWNYNDYVRYKNYVEKRAPFRPTLKIGPFWCDKASKLYKPSYLSGIYPMRMLKSFEIKFVPKKVIFGKAIGETYIHINSLMPKYEATYLLNKYAIADGYYDDKHVFVHGMPTKLVTLHTVLNNCLSEIQEEMQQKEAEYKDKHRHKESHHTNNEHNATNNSKNTHLSEAMALFMMENLDVLTEHELRTIRNRLMKSFHPDSSNDADKYAQKINEAYEILKNNIRK